MASCNTVDGARYHKAATIASVLVLARPAGTTKYSTEEQLQRTATVCSSPEGFLALWKEFVRACAVHPELEEPDGNDVSVADGVRQPSDEDRLKTCLFYGNRLEWGKAYQAWAPRAQRADGECPLIQAKVLALTPQCLPPRSSTTDAEPGVEPVRVTQKTVDKSIKRRKAARKGGPTIISYETLGNICSTTKGAKSVCNFANAFAQGKVHPDILSLTADIDMMCLWKDDECTAIRVIGMCDIFVRFAEGCCFNETRVKADKYFTSMLPEDEAEHVAAEEEAAEELASARDAVASADVTGEALLIEAAARRLETAERNHAAAETPPNVPMNYILSSSGCAMMSFTLKTWHQKEPSNLTISGDIRNMYPTADSPVDAEGEPDSEGHGREKIFAWFRLRLPELLPAVKLVLAAPSLLRVSRAGGPMVLPGRTVHADDLADPDPEDVDLICRSTAGTVQGRSLSGHGAVGLYHEMCHVVQKANKTSRIAGLADDVAINDVPAAACATYKYKVQHQLTVMGLRENIAKAAVYSPTGNIDCVPAALPGSPHHRDKNGDLTGPLRCIKMVGGFHGDDDACAAATAERLAMKLAPLDVMDRARETEYINNVSQVKHNVLRYAVAPMACFTAQITEPSVACGPLNLAQGRIRRSWELAVAAEASPQQIRDDAWMQACLPSEGFGGCNLTDSTCTTDPSGAPINHLYTATFMSCWPRLREMVPDLRDVCPLAEDAPRFIQEAVTGYNETRRRRGVLEATHAAMLRQKHYTVRGGNVVQYHPPGLPLPDTLPAAAELFDTTSKTHTPSPGKLAMVNNITVWHELKARCAARDERVATAPENGDSGVKNREASRLVAVSQPYAGQWHAIAPDGTARSKLATQPWQAVMQRQLGLHLSGSKQVLLDLAELGETVDFYGDDASNGAGLFLHGTNHNRRHNAALSGWSSCISAVATTPTVLGDKAHGARTKQFNDFNDGHVVDIAEIGSGDRGEDKCVEVKVFAALKKSGSNGRGTKEGGGTACSTVGHKYGFGNTEEQCRVDNLGCKPRGRKSDGPFRHDTGAGWVKGKKGAYNDAIYKKNNTVEVLLHENLGGGFSPPAATKMRRNGRKARDHGIDRTPYQAGRKISFVSFHTRAISMGITKAEAATLVNAASKLKGILSGKRNGGPAAHS